MDNVSPSVQLGGALRETGGPSSPFLPRAVDYSGLLSCLLTKYIERMMWQYNYSTDEGEQVPRLVAPITTLPMWLYSNGPSVSAVVWSVHPIGYPIYHPWQQPLFMHSKPIAEPHFSRTIRFHLWVRIRSVGRSGLCCSWDERIATGSARSVQRRSGENSMDTKGTNSPIRAGEAYGAGRFRFCTKLQRCGLK